MEKIAFGDGPVAGKLKAMELLGKHIGLFLPKKVPELERSADDIRAEIHRILEANS